MADDIKKVTTVTTTASAPAAASAQAVKVSETKAAPAAKKPAAKKAAVKKTTTTTKAAKPAAKKTATKTIAKSAAKMTATKETTKKAVAKKAMVKKPSVKSTDKKAVAQLDATDTIKLALWNKISKAKAKKFKENVAIQIHAKGLDSFYIAIKEGKPEIERYYFHNNNGEFYSSEKELLKLASGKCDVIGAVRSDLINFEGNLYVFLKIMDLFI